MGVHLIFTLQDGEEKISTSLFPLIHLVQHGIDFLSKTGIFRVINLTRVTIYSGIVFEKLKILNAALNQKLTVIKDAVKHSERSRDPIRQFPIITTQMINCLEDVYSRYKQFSSINLTMDQTDQAAIKFFTLINLVQNRKNVIDRNVLAVNSTKIVTTLTELQDLFGNALNIPSCRA